MSLCPLGHDTTASFRTRAPGSFKRLLDGARCTDARARRAALGLRAQPWVGKLPLRSDIIERSARRGAPWRGLWGAGRGELWLARALRRSAPRAFTVQRIRCGKIRTGRDARRLTDRA